MPQFLGSGKPYGVFEKQTIIADGSSYRYTLHYQVGSSTSLLVMYGGVLQEPGAGKAYSIDNGGAEILFSFVPQVGVPLYLIFLGRELSVPRTVGLEPKYETFVGDGTDTTFTLVNGPVTIDAVILYVNTIIQRPNVDFTLSGSQITFTTPPPNNAPIDVYIHGVERLDIATVPDGSITNVKLAPGAVTADKLNLIWQNFSLALQTFGGMGISGSPVILEQKYMDLGSELELKLHFRVTFTGTPDNKVRINLPQNNNGSSNVAGIVDISTLSSMENGHVRWGAISNFDIHRQNGVNFVIGTEYDVKIRVKYEAA